MTGDLYRKLQAIIAKMSKTVFINGVFDVLTPAHFRQLTYARALAGGTLGSVVVAIDSDGKARQDKGPMRPIFDENARKEALMTLTYPLGATGNVAQLVDEVAIFDTNEELHQLIIKHSPDHLIKGSDWEGNIVGSDIAKEVNIVPRDERYSSSKIINAVLNKFFTNAAAGKE